MLMLIATFGVVVSAIMYLFFKDDNSRNIAKVIAVCSVLFVLADIILFDI